MPVLHLGVIDIPYATPSYAAPKSPKVILGQVKRGKVSGPKPDGSHSTTGDVAEILEEKYHVQELFFELHQEEIAAELEESIGGALKNILLGAPGTISPTDEATSAIEDMFKKYLSNRELDSVEPGVPTAAALKGVSHRFAHPYAKRGPRPSFIDTGLYEANFHVWMD